MNSINTTVLTVISNEDSKFVNLPEDVLQGSMNFLFKLDI